MNGAGRSARGAAKRTDLPSGRRAGGRSACEPRYGRAPFGRSPAGRSGLLTRRLMVVVAPIKPLGSAKAAHGHGEIITNTGPDRPCWGNRKRSQRAPADGDSETGSGDRFGHVPERRLG